MISSTSKKPAEFAWPSFYELPPFFTLQPVEATRKKQTQIWCELILNFCRHHNIFELDVNDSKTPLFYNEKIKRKLSPESARHFLDELVNQGFAEWIDPAQKNRALIMYRKPDEWAAIFRKWISSNGLVDTVFTLYELSKGQNSQGEEFSGLDQRIILKALRILEQQGKAKLFAATTGDFGVKFFN